MCGMVHMRRLDDTLQKLILSFCCSLTRDRIQIVRLRDKHFCRLCVCGIYMYVCACVVFPCTYVPVAVFACAGQCIDQRST